MRTIRRSAARGAAMALLAIGIGLVTGWLAQHMQHGDHGPTPLAAAGELNASAITPARMPPPIPKYVCMGFDNGTTICYVEGPGIVPNTSG